MNEKEHNFVQNLAMESEKIYENDDLMINMSNKIDFSDIVAWNGEIHSVSPIRISSKLSNGKVPKLIPRRKSDSENKSYNIIEDSKTKQTFLQNKFRLSSCNRKLPEIVQRVLIPKLHYVQAPLKQHSQFAVTTNIFYDQILSPKLPDSDFSQRNIMKRTIYPIDLMKKRELLYDYSPIKPSSKFFEISTDALRNSIRPRIFTKGPSSIEPIYNNINR